MTDHVTKWIIGFVSAGALALSGWGFSTTSTNQSRLTAVETEIKRLERIENKVDWLIEERVRQYGRRGEAP